MTEFEALLTKFNTYKQKARLLEGGFFVNCAFVGFTRYAPPEHWGAEQIELILARLAGDLSDENLEWYEEAAPQIAAFSCLALGALLGAYRQGAIGDEEFLRGDVLLPGFVLMNLERVQSS
jgi:hypothetical protein